MAQTDLDLQIRDCINSFVEGVTSLVRRAAVDSVRSALGGDIASARSARASAPRTRSAPAGDGRDRRSSDQIAKLADRLLAHVKTHPGQRMEQITKALNTTTKTLRLPVRKLIALKMIKFTGQKRATKYHTA